VESQWRSLGFNVIVGEIDGQWSKARAVAVALKQSDADTLIVTDADLWSEAAPAAALSVDTTVGWAVPFSTVRRLDLPSTTEVLNGGPLGGKLARPPFRAVPGGGLTILRRDLYDQVPLDARFIGWNYEDVAWGQALTFVAGRPKMYNVALWHLWHPPAPKGPSPERTIGTELRGRYSKARRNPEAMEALLSEAREALRC
jgi:hypothetical protein